MRQATANFTVHIAVALRFIQLSCYSQLHQTFTSFIICFSTSEQIQHAPRLTSHLQQALSCSHIHTQKFIKHLMMSHTPPGEGATNGGKWHTLISTHCSHALNKQSFLVCHQLHCHHHHDLGQPKHPDLKSFRMAQPRWQELLLNASLADAPNTAQTML
jgi:hypothetical protein